jgi:hypothetical protein
LPVDLRSDEADYVKRNVKNGMKKEGIEPGTSENPSHEDPS